MIQRMNMDIPLARGKQQQLEKLEQEFKDLLESWNTMKRSKSRRYNGYLPDDQDAVSGFLYVLDSSPRDLMSFLQQETSSPSPWNDDEEFKVEEIRRQRRTVIEGGKLKRRRLFAEPEWEKPTNNDGSEEVSNEDSEMKSVISDHSFQNDEKIDNGEITSKSSSNNYVYASGEPFHQSGNIAAMVGADEDGSEKDRQSNATPTVLRCHGRRSIAAIVCLSIALALSAFCITFFKSFEGYAVHRPDYIVIALPT